MKKESHHWHSHQMHMKEMPKSAAVNDSGAVFIKKANRMLILKNSTILLSTLILLAGCSLTPDYKRPFVDTPPWKEAKSSDSVEIAANWWKEFGSDELDALIDESLSYNNDLQASLQRIKQARSELQITGASLLPSASVTADSLKMSKISGSEENEEPSLSASSGISYELDLFGANRARTDAARKTFLGTEYAHDALALIIMGDVAQNYFNVLNLKERYRIAIENQKSTEDILKAVKARFEIGRLTALEVSQQETVLSNAQAEAASLEQELALAQNALAVLVGKPPQIFSVSGDDLDTVKIPAMASLQPSELLERRPDIKSAEAELIAANADTGVARAAFFPSVNLGANLLMAANPSSMAVALASSLYAPIFQGGRLQGNLNRVTARQEELAANYQKTVLVAFQEAEDALVKVKTTKKRETALKQAEAKAFESYSIAKNQYSLSVVDFQSLLESQRLMLASKDSYARARFETLSARIDLFKAMGGGWKQTSQGN